MLRPLSPPLFVEPAEPGQHLCAADLAGLVRAAVLHLSPKAVLYVHTI